MQTTTAKRKQLLPGQEVECVLSFGEYFIKGRNYKVSSGNVINGECKTAHTFNEDIFEQYFTEKPFFVCDMPLNQFIKNGGELYFGRMILDKRGAYQGIFSELFTDKIEIIEFMFEQLKTVYISDCYIQTVCNPIF